MIRWFLQSLPPLLFVFAAAGCIHGSPVSSACVERDWYEVGRRDGSQGKKLDRWDDYQQVCKNTLSEHTFTVYSNGRYAGLADYCQAENAFELGRTGLSYEYVCPPTMEGDFLLAYKRGQEARSEERERAKKQRAQADEGFVRPLIDDERLEPEAL